MTELTPPTTSATTSSPTTKLIDYATHLRWNIKAQCINIKTFKNRVLSTEPSETEDRGEVIANIMLAYRHLEDARMRLWKVIEAHQWENIYDKKQVG